MGLKELQEEIAKGGFVNKFYGGTDGGGMFNIGAKKPKMGWLITNGVLDKMLREIDVIRKVWFEMWNNNDAAGAIWREVDQVYDKIEAFRRGNRKVVVGWVPIQRDRGPDFLSVAMKLKMQRGDIQKQITKLTRIKGVFDKLYKEYSLVHRDEMRPVSEIVIYCDFLIKSIRGYRE